MAMKIAYWMAPALMILAAFGCGQTQVAEEKAPTQNGPTIAPESGHATTPAEDKDSFPIVNRPAAVLPVTPDSTPDEVVAQFLKAMKTGNNGVAAGLLTSTAREETAKHSLAVQPPGSPSAVYEVTESEISTEDPNLAQVGCVWVEKDETGLEHREQVVWVVIKHDEGWRVCGMATNMPTRKEPVFFDFENPKEMMAIMDQISREQEELAAADPNAVAAETTEQAPSLSPESDTIRQARTPDEPGNSLRKKQ